MTRSPVSARRAPWLAIALGLAVIDAQAAPLEAYGKLPFIETMKVSPSGHRLAFVTTDGEARTIVVKNFDDDTFVGHINAGTNKIRDVIWAGEDHVIITASVSNANPEVTGWKEYSSAIDYDLKRQTERRLITPMARPQVRTVNGKPTVFVRGFSLSRAGSGIALYRLDLDGGASPFVLEPGTARTNGFLVDASGRPLAETEYDGAEQEWRLKLWRGAWTSVDHRIAPLETPVLMGLGRSARSAVVFYPSDDIGNLREFAADGSVADLPLSLDGDFRLLWDDATSTLAGAYELVGEEGRTLFLDPADQRRWRIIQAAFPDQIVAPTSFSDDHKRFLVRADSGKESPAFYLVDMITGKATWIADEYAGIGAKDIAEVRPITFAASDGLALTGYLTLPNGRAARGLPLVVLAHDGPDARDTPGFDWLSQAIASRGYAVMRLNFRGSKGMGHAFRAAGYGEWGRKMQTDLTDGVAYLAKSGLIDPSRVCIVGAAYGGYAALAGATLQSGAYRCAVSVAGPADPRRMEDYASGPTGEKNRHVQRLWARYLGSSDTLAAISPVAQAAHASIPILLIHGKNDAVVPFEQSTAMERALKAAGKPVELVPLAGEDHWLSQGDTRLKMLTNTVAFLEKNNPPN